MTEEILQERRVSSRGRYAARGVRQAKASYKSRPKGGHRPQNVQVHVLPDVVMMLPPNWMMPGVPLHEVPGVLVPDIK